MKQSRQKLLALLAAHVTASYCAYIPLVLARPHAPIELTYVVLAPVFAPVALIVRTFALPHAYAQLLELLESWGCYAITFFMVCLLLRKRAAVTMFALVPALMTAFVAAQWVGRGVTDRGPAGTAAESPLLGKPAPEFVLAALTGERCSVSNEKGKVLLINFWSTICPPCRSELKEIINVLAQDPALRSRGFRIWAINIYDAPETTRRFVSKNCPASVGIGEPGLRS